MPIHRKFNEDFFKTWSSQMAYVLGFFTADGSMYRTKRGTHFIEFQITDEELLHQIRDLLGSNHKISVRQRDLENSHWKKSYRLQVGSKVIFDDLLKLGLVPNKSKTIALPVIPQQHLSDFLRGYFDGDGNVVYGFFKRKNRPSLQHVFSVRFTSGSRTILSDIKILLTKVLETRGSLLYYGQAWRLNFGSVDSLKLFDFMYRKSDLGDLIYLDRKYKIFERELLMRA